MRETVDCAGGEEIEGSAREEKIRTDWQQKEGKAREKGQTRKDTPHGRSKWYLLRCWSSTNVSSAPEVDTPRSHFLGPKIGSLAAMVDQFRLEGDKVAVILAPVAPEPASAPLGDPSLSRDLRAPSPCPC